MRVSNFSKIDYAIIAAFAAVGVLPVIFWGVPGGNDATQHYRFVHHVVDALRAGDIFPSIAGNSNHGFGDVGLRIYPPLAYYAIAFIFIVTGDWYVASLVTFFLIFLIGGIGVYLLAREEFSSNQALAAAAIYIFAPFHLNEFYNTFLYAQFAAGAILPFCFLFVTRVVKRNKLADSIWLAVAYACLVLTHLPLTIIGSVALGLYALVLTKGKSISTLAKLAAAVFSGLILSSFYWIRMLAEKDWIKHSDPFYFSNIWSYSENYLLSARRFTDFAGENDIALWFGDLLLIATVLVCVPAIVFFYRSRERAPVLIGTSALLVFSLFMITPLSFFIWDNVLLLQKVQFPWRWMSIVSMTVSIIAGPGLVCVGEQLKDANFSLKHLGIAIALLPFVVLSVFVVKAPHFTPRQDFNARTELLRDGDTFEGWWPVWAQRAAFYQKDKVSAKDRAVEVKSWDSEKRSFTIQPGEGQIVSVATFYYPHWHAEIDGKPSAVQPGPTGLIEMRVPENASDVVLTFTEPHVLKAAKYTSLAAWTGLGLLLISITYAKKNYGTDSGN